MPKWRESKRNSVSLYNSNTDSLKNSCFEFLSHAVTHTGYVRSRNEDSILALNDESVWVVADGMGGHHAGDFASQTITNNMGLFKQQNALEDSILLLEENILNSNSIIRKKAQKLGKNTTIGSTVVCVYLWQDCLFIFWAGDSRLYRFRDEKLERMTEDHSYVEELVRMGKIEANEAEAHPAANVVLKAVGIDDTLAMDFDYTKLQEDDIFVLCSDGLYKDLEEAKLTPIISSYNSDMITLSEKLLEASLAAGGTDNTSIIALKAKIKD
jgi:serine/threonine protein phosphatase PrpC